MIISGPDSAFAHVFYDTWIDFDDFEPGCGHGNKYLTT